MEEVDNEQAFAVFERIPRSTSSERLRAARFLARYATSAHRNRVLKIKVAERNSWVRRALDQALQRSEAGRSVAPTVAAGEMQQTAFPDARLYEEIRAQAIEETAALFLHELRQHVGILEGNAAREIDDYACSRTKSSVNRIRSFLDAIDTLRKASAVPTIQEFDMTDLVVRVAEHEATGGRAILEITKESVEEIASLNHDAEQAMQQTVIKLSLGRRDPVVTTGDPTLVELAVTNGLRNAIEAVLELQEPNPNAVVLNWGVTDTDSWVVILDEGCGLPTGLGRLTEPGSSTKPKNEGHLGMGLPITKSAIESMHGTFQLTPRSRVGVSCEIRWPREGFEI